MYKSMEEVCKEHYEEYQARIRFLRSEIDRLNAEIDRLNANFDAYIKDYKEDFYDKRYNGKKLIFDTHCKAVEKREEEIKRIVRRIDRIVPDDYAMMYIDILYY